MQDVIAICGARGSGKNTAADMLQYICNTPAWLHSYALYRLLGKVIGKKGHQLTSFAAPLKRTLAGMLNIDPERFEDRSFKEKTYICLDTMMLEKHPGVVLSGTRFDTALKNGDYHTIQSSYITIRQFMQFVGTEVLRGALGDALWTTLTLQRTGKIIISDCRFMVEAREIKKRNGKIICLMRDGCPVSQHASDQEMFDMISEGLVDKIIDNNGSKSLLFKQLCSI